MYYLTLSKAYGIIWRQIIQKRCYQNLAPIGVFLALSVASAKNDVWRLTTLQLLVIIMESRIVAQYFFSGKLWRFFPKWAIFFPFLIFITFWMGRGKVWKYNSPKHCYKYYRPWLMINYCKASIILGCNCSQISKNSRTIRVKHYLVQLRLTFPAKINLYNENYLRDINWRII